MEQQPWVCPQCTRAIGPEDTIVFGPGLLGHLDCRRPRVLSAEEHTLLLLYGRDHHVSECVRCAGKFHLQEVSSLDSLGIRSHGCPWCHTDLTDSIRAHLYGCAMLPVEVGRRAQAAREATRSLVKQSHQLRDAADVAIREAEAALHALRETLRQSADPPRWLTVRPARAEGEVTDTDARLRHPWLRINRVLARHAPHALERGGVSAGEGRVQEGARAQKSDATRFNSGVEGDRVGMTCSCGTVLVRVVSFG
jgi:hypothetical protein